MERPRFSEMLVERRHKLGLSIVHASQVLKLREEVLVAFEDGDWDRLPKSGYAQGMLSSYARYLGLDAREIVDLYQKESRLRTSSSNTQGIRRRNRSSQYGGRADELDFTQDDYPISGTTANGRSSFGSNGYLTDDADGTSATTTSLPRAKSVPLTGTRLDSTSRGLTSTSGAFYQDRDVDARSSTALSRESSNARSSRSQRQISGAGPYTRRRLSLSERHEPTSEYVDEQEEILVTPTRSSVSVLGRRNSKSTARRNSTISRPNSTSSAGSRRRQQTSAGVPLSLLRDKRIIISAIVLVLVVVVTVILTLAVSSCVSSKSDSDNKTISVTSPDEGSPATVNDTGTVSEGTSTGSALEPTSEGGISENEEGTSEGGVVEPEAEPEDTIVSVYIPSGAVTWLEINNGGVSEVAETVTGPWGASYTVTSSITIQAGNPDVVAVSKNSEKVSFTTKASGLGSVTIDGTSSVESLEGESGEGSE